MSWVRRPREDRDVYAPNECPTYTSPELFTIKLFHGGVMSGKPKKYYGGDFDYFDCYDGDTLSLLELGHMLTECGVLGAYIYYYKLPTTDWLVPPSRLIHVYVVALQPIFGDPPVEIESQEFNPAEIESLEFNPAEIESQEFNPSQVLLLEYVEGDKGCDLGGPQEGYEGGDQGAGFEEGGGDQGAGFETNEEGGGDQGDGAETNEEGGGDQRAGFETNEEGGGDQGAGAETNEEGGGDQGGEADNNKEASAHDKANGCEKVVKRRNKKTKKDDIEEGTAADDEGNEDAAGDTQTDAPTEGSQGGVFNMQQPHDSTARPSPLGIDPLQFSTRSNATVTSLRNLELAKRRREGRAKQKPLWKH
uniref:Uncharacterized protein n=1 Tax=Daucus carota subsp. sativus TaxID=79200 RepID=A0A164UA66_DAUCS